MEPAMAQLTIFFEGPFWIGLYQRQEEGQYSVCKITFGAEPKDQKVYDFLLHHWHCLSFSPSLPGKTLEKAAKNPKRQQREIQRQLQQPSIGTKAQQALAQQRDLRKQTRKEISRQQQEEAQTRRFALRQEKRKDKHRGH